MLRKIIQLEENKCDGCGECIPACHEGALQIIDGKARLISDLFCDGLGACLGICPTGALTIVEREAEPYNESKVMDYILKGGINVIKAHLEHLREHEEFEYLREALEYLRERGIENPPTEKVTKEESTQCGCNGSREISSEQFNSQNDNGVTRISHLAQWPIQLHLITPMAGFLKNSDLLLVADCCGFAHPNFQMSFLKQKVIAIACPKLDSNKQSYLEKLVVMINEAGIKSITVLIMQVPCCSGLVNLAKQALNASARDIPLSYTVIGINGEILHSEVLN